MVEPKKMLNKVSKCILIIGVMVFSFLSFSSVTLALNYGSGSYSSDLYSATIPSATATPTAGTYTSTQSVTLATGGSNTIRYSTTATPGDCTSGTLYSSPIQISSSQTIYTLTCDTYGNSTPASFSYIISRLSSSGSSALFRYNNLISTGNIKAAEELRKEFPNQIKQQNTNQTASTSALKGVSRVLKIKISGNDVKSLQTYLNTIGFDSGTPDGSFGQKTLSAVIAFQKINNITADGVVGPNTLAILNKTSAITTATAIVPVTNSQIIRTLKKDMKGNDIKILQTYLSSKGYDTGTPDGSFGLKTLNAVKKFQKDNNLIADGIVGQITQSLFK